jgi:hypothetical protein
MRIPKLKLGMVIPDVIIYITIILEILREKDQVSLGYI